MKTPMQEMLEWVENIISYLPNESVGARNQLIIVKTKVESLLEKEKEVMVDFAYNCRNLMAADEFAITHWYDKTFNTKEK